MNLKRLLVYLSCFVCLATFCIGQTAVLMPQPKIQFLNQNGLPLAGGCVNTYAAGTTTNQATYKDSTSSAVNTNPVILDSAGRASIFTTRGVLYKVVVTSFGGTNCSTGTLQYTQDNIPSGSSLVIAGANGQVQYNGFGTLAASPTFTWNNGSGTLSVPALNTTSGGFLGGSFGGNPIWTGTHSFNGSVTFPGGIAGSTTLTNPGVFVNGVMNQGFYSTVNGASALNEFHTLYNPAQTATSAISAALSVPSTSTVQQANGIESYVIDNRTNPITPTVAVFGAGRAAAAGARTWGGNFVGSDQGSLLATTNLYGEESDCFISLVGTLCTAHLAEAFWLGGIQPTNSIAFRIGQPQGAVGNAHWNYGFRCDTNATVTPDSNNGCLYAFPVATGNSQNSQGLTFVSTNSSGANPVGVLYQLPAGDLNFTSSVPNTNFKFNSNNLIQEVGVVDLTAQTAAITTTTLYAVVAAGEYRLAWNAKVTTAAGTSSTIGALTIVYTDPDGVVQTVTAGGQASGGVFATTNTANTTGTMLLGMPLLLNCKAGTNITYAFGYASNAANAMNYNLHIRLESL